MNADEIVVDLDAVRAEIHDHVGEKADTFDFDDAIALRDALNGLQSELRTAQSHLETQMLAHLEAGVQQRGSRIFKRKRNIVERFRHDLIKAAVGAWARREACNDEGEVSAVKAVDNAVQAMADLYLSPSTKAKIGALETYGLDRRAISEKEDKGWKLDVEELDERSDD